MIELTIPGYRKLQIKHLVLDLNGTIACDGKLIAGVRECLETLADKIQIHILTADTFGKAESQLENAPCILHILPKENQDIGKLNYVKKLDSQYTACIGNGRNDRLMLKEALLGIAVILNEGAAAETVMSADVVFTDIVAALEMLTNPLRLTATLRS
ncbi:MAG: ATPase P [Desulfobacteraceae bacterium]|nr:ATPase P [Desulfobacteraceae bacterium]